MKIIKLFFQSIGIHYFKKDQQRLKKLYYEIMDIQEKYIEEYCDEEDKIQRFKERIYQMLELVSIREQREFLKMQYNPGIEYRGLKLRENIINDMYIELWLIGRDLFLYIFERRGEREQIIPFDIEDPYLLRIDQVYYALKNKGKPKFLEEFSKA